MKRTTIIFAVPCLLCFACGYALSQNNVQSTPTTLAAEINDLDLELRGFGQARPDDVGTRGAAVARNAAGDSALTDAVLKQAYTAARTNRGQFNDLKLQSLQIAQNQRMIQLLEQIAEQKKAG